MHDREKLIELLKNIPQVNHAQAAVEGLDYVFGCAADHLIANSVTVRERGRWIPHYETFDEDAAVGILGGTYQTGWQCSVCGRYEPGKEPYCNCGADMRPMEEDNV